MRPREPAGPALPRAGPPPRPRPLHERRCGGKKGTAWVQMEAGSGAVPAASLPAPPPTPFFFFLPREARKRDSPPRSLGGSEWERRTEGVCGAARGGDWEKLIFLARPPSLQALPRPLLAAPPRRRPPLAEPRSLLRGSPGGSGGRNTHTRAHTLGAHN